MIKIGLNIDHVATLRNARGEGNPNIIDFIRYVESFNIVNSITAHLREDRRHIKDEDMQALIKESKLPINMEMAATDEMFDIASKLKPQYVCIVPEKRKELTTEGGLDLFKLKKDYIISQIKRMQDLGISISLFIEADKNQIKEAKELGANSIEIHTGKYCLDISNKVEFNKIKLGAELANNIGLNVNMGHGINYDSLQLLNTIDNIKEYNIGHFIIAESLYYGIKEPLLKIRKILDNKL